MVDFTKTGRQVGGVPDEGLQGQVLTKKSNTPGDYAWEDIPIQINRYIEHDDSRVEVLTNNGYVRITVNGTEVSTFNDSGLSVSTINGYSVVSRIVNPVKAPSSATDMLNSTNEDKLFLYTPNQLKNLVEEVSPSGVPLGTIFAWYSPLPAPQGYLKCDKTFVYVEDNEPLAVHLGQGHTNENISVVDGRAYAINPPDSNGNQNFISLEDTRVIEFERDEIRNLADLLGEYAAAYYHTYQTGSTLQGPIVVFQFHTPDFRGMFLRGYSDGSTYDSGRYFYSQQFDQNKQHRHIIAHGNDGDGGHGGENCVSMQDDGDEGRVAPARTVSYEGGDEARPVNKAVTWIIKA